MSSERDLIEPSAQPAADQEDNRVQMERVVTGGRIIAIRSEGGKPLEYLEKIPENIYSFVFSCGYSSKIMGDVQSFITSLTSHLSPDGGERKSPRSGQSPPYSILLPGRVQIRLLTVYWSQDISGLESL